MKQSYGKINLRAATKALIAQINIITNSQLNLMSDALDGMIKGFNSAVAMYDRFGQRRP